MNRRQLLLGAVALAAAPALPALTAAAPRVFVGMDVGAAEDFSVVISGHQFGKTLAGQRWVEWRVADVFRPGDEVMLDYQTFRAEYEAEWPPETPA